LSCSDSNELDSNLSPKLFSNAARGFLAENSENQIHSHCFHDSFIAYPLGICWVDGWFGVVFDDGFVCKMNPAVRNQ
jgi:hypothetical protein